MAVWALRRLNAERADRLRAPHLANEPDPEVKAEWIN
jgi:hypothetical protein